MPRNSIKSFTLVELLIVIAILAILAAAVVIVLNPAELLAQARDSQRMSDIEVTKKAVDLFIVDNPTVALGTAQRVYISIPDTSATCANVTGLPTLPAGWQYVCVTTANLRNTNGTGWIPVNLNSVYGGSPIPYLPLDPANDAASGRYYSYVMGGSYALSALLESQKNFALKDGGRFVEMYEAGSDLSLLPVSRDPSLVGYWSFDGSGSISNGQTTGLTDLSGKGNNGTAVNTNGSGMIFTAGKIGNAVQLDGVDDYINAGSNNSLNLTQELTISIWVKYAGLGASAYPGVIERRTVDASGYSIRIYKTSQKPFFQTSNPAGDSQYNWNNSVGLDNWKHIVVIYSTPSGRAVTYMDGVQDANFAKQQDMIGATENLFIGLYSGYYFDGLIDDVRVYARALTPLEIKSLYDATK